DPPLSQLFAQRLDFPLRPVHLPLQFGDACGSVHGGKLYTTRTFENVPELFYAERRYHLRDCMCFRSSPFTSIASSSARIVTLRCFSLAAGQRKRPFSRRFAHTHNPLPSHTSALSLVRVRLENKNRYPLSGSWPS